MRRFYIGSITGALFSLGALPAVASVTISEVMYDVPGADDPHEWVEIFNDSASEVDISDWRFNDGSNHTLVIDGEKGGQGSLTLAPHAYAILADSALDFLAQRPGFSATVIDTVMSLNNSGDTLSLINGESVVHSVSYTSELGAAGDGNTLHRSGGSFVVGAPSPGSGNMSAPILDDETGDERDTMIEEDRSTFAPPDRRTISVDAGQDREIIAGADALFHVDAYGFTGDELEAARFVWNFGDGAVAEGAELLHTYQFPGKYIVSVTASSGKYSGVDYVGVMVTDSPLVISGIQSGDAGYVAVTNSASKDINLSLWHLAVGEKYFTFPRGSYISARGTVKFANNITGLPVGASPTALWYPNGVVAYLFGERTPMMTSVSVEKAVPPSGETSSRIAIDGKTVPQPTVFVSATSTTVGEVTKDDVYVSGASAVILSNPEMTDGVSLWVLILISVIVLGSIAVFWIVREYRVVPQAENVSEHIRREADTFEIVE